MIWIIVIIIVAFLLLWLLPACFVFMIGTAIGDQKAFQKSAWEEAAKYNRTKDEWQHLSDDEKRLRINCIATILDDCGTIYSDEEITKYLMGEDSTINITFQES